MHQGAVGKRAGRGACLAIISPELVWPGYRIVCRTPVHVRQAVRGGTALATDV